VIGGQGTVGNVPWASGVPWERKQRVDIYDPATDSWSSGSPSPVAISAGAACAVGTQIYVFGEEGEKGAFAYAFDTSSDRWSNIAQPLPRNGQACLTAGEKIYVAGGRSAAMGNVDVDEVELYIPASDSWQAVAVMPNPRHWLGATSVDDDLVFVGGVRAPDQQTVDTVDMLHLTALQTP